jgi:hypothetical protein
MVKNRFNDIMNHQEVNNTVRNGTFAITSKITKIEKLEGDAQIIMTRGKKRHLYDFNAKLDFVVEVIEITNEQNSSVNEEKSDNKNNDTTQLASKSEEEGKKDETIVSVGKKTKQYKGNFVLNEITPGSDFEEFQLKFKKPLTSTSSWSKEIEGSAQQLLDKIISDIKEFELEYKQL